MYTPLGIKTNSTLLSSLIKIDDLIKYALKNNMKSLTITDNNMYAVMDFYNACIKNNIKPIVGITVTLEHEFILYAKNYAGYKNLMKIISNDIDIEYLKKYSNDLICIIPYKSISLYDEFSKIYEDIFIGYSTLEESNIPYKKVFINEVLCIEKSDTAYLKYLKAIKDGVSVESIKDDFSNNYIITDEKLINIDIENNKYIVDSCNLVLPEPKIMIPKFDCGEVDSFTYLKRMCAKGLRRIFGDVAPKVYVERLKYELDIINKMGFNDYFLIVADFVEYAKNNNILVGPGRGSAAGSLVSYCLNITTIDPIKYNLYFERFLNPDRISMPDIDIDFEDSKRMEVINYCINKYGINNVASVIAFGTLKSKQSIRDVGRCMNVQVSAVDKICRYLDSNLSLMDNYNKNSNLRNYLELDSKLQKLYKIATKLEGIRRHTTIHAAGLVIAGVNLDEIIPLVKHHNGYLTAFSKEHLEDMGLLKIDFLAISNLTTIHNILEEINSDLTFDNIPLNDYKTMELFKRADTLGIFQFESSGMRNMLAKFKPNSLEELIAIIALYRPGPMDSIPSYIRRKNNEEEIDYIDPVLVDILKPTYGIIIYQEQIMKIANVMASYSMSEADLLRKAMSKKKEDILIKEKDKFISRSIKNGHSEEVSTKVYNLILKFASYGFNRAHSVAYTIVAYKMAYLKVNYPLIFASNLLSMYQGSEKTKDYILECKRNNIKFLNPDINYSDYDYKIENNAIRYPLSIIKGIGKNTINNIKLARENGFTDIYDFFAKTHKYNIGKSNLETLIQAGVFDSFYNRKTMIDNLDVLINYGELASTIDINYALKPEIIIVEDYPEIIKMEQELSLYGFYISNHPVTKKKELDKDYVNLDSVNTKYNKVINIIGTLDFVKEITTKKGELMAFYKVSDEFSSLSLTLFPSVYEEYRDIKKKDIIKVRGKVERRFDEYQLIVEKITKL